MLRQHLSRHRLRSFQFPERQSSVNDAENANEDQKVTGNDSGYIPVVLVLLLLCLGADIWAANLLFNYGWRSRRGWLAVGLSLSFFGCAAITFWSGCYPWHWYRCLQNSKKHSQDCQSFQHNSTIVPQKSLDRKLLLGYSIYREAKEMANVLNTDKQIAIIAALAEGSSIRSIERITGVHRDTIMRLGVKVGQGCTALMDAKMRDLPCSRLEMDEIWGFVGKKERHVREGDIRRGQRMDVLRYRCRNQTGSCFPGWGCATLPRQTPLWTT